MRSKPIAIRLMFGMLCCAGLCLQCSAAKVASAAQRNPVAHRTVDAEGHQWWQHAVFYELYPRSFADSNNDGVGDLNGITGKLDYLRALGLDALWITPCFPSPQVDFGYDVADYRDGERTPMQWTAAANAGFTSGTPWLPVPSSATMRNVASESADPNSVLNFYRHLLRLRHTNRALLDGNYVAQNETDPNVLSFAREYRHRAVLVLLNMSAMEQSVEAAVPGFSQGRMKALLRTPGVDESPSGRQKLSLPPFAVYIGQITR